jgi:catechol 2,3-dioxygenase-like lactoylglutathione lyase family enzyme
MCTTISTIKVMSYQKLFILFAKCTHWLFLSLVLATTAQAQENLKLHSVGLAVSDVDKSLAFYQRLLGLPVQGRVGSTVFLQLGGGPQYLSLSPTIEENKPRITYIGLSADNFDTQAFTEQLAAKGYKEGAPAAANDAGRLGRANTYRIEDGVLHFVDMEGVEIQIAPSSYCGSTTFNCGTVASEPDGKLNILGINHFTTFVANAKRANDFYMELLDLGIQSYQGPTTPAIAVGDGLQFLMFVGGAQSGQPASPANLHHVSFSVENFNVEGIFSVLDDNGFKPRADGVTTAPPLSYYVSLRMPNRGGAEGGTPEVYLTDPDGILLQVQDPSYCGGGGYLGDQC